jgi:hypothetical protein
MNNATEWIKDEVEGWRATGRPSVLAEFVYRNGRAFNQVRYVRRPGKRKHCFYNALRYAEQNQLAYVEGYGFRGSGAVPHAWRCDGTVAIETTWRESSDQPDVYFGVVFDPKRALDRVCETGFRGLFAPTYYYDREFMAQVDPGFDKFFDGLTSGTLREL